MIQTATKLQSPTQHCFILAIYHYSLREQVNFQWNDDEVRQKGCCLYKNWKTTCTPAVRYISYGEV